MRARQQTYCAHEEGRKGIEGVNVGEQLQKTGADVDLVMPIVAIACKQARYRQRTTRTE